MGKIYIELLATIGIQIIPFIFIIDGYIHRDGIGLNNGDGLLVLGVLLLFGMGIIYTITYLLDVMIKRHNKYLVPEIKYLLLIYWVFIDIIIVIYLSFRNFF